MSKETDKDDLLHACLYALGEAIANTEYLLKGDNLEGLDQMYVDDVTLFEDLIERIARELKPGRKAANDA